MNKIVLTLLGLTLMTGCANNRPKLEVLATRYCHCHSSTIFIIEYHPSWAAVTCDSGAFHVIELDSYITECK